VAAVATYPTLYVDQFSGHLTFGALKLAMAFVTTNMTVFIIFQSSVYQSKLTKLPGFVFIVSVFNRDKKFFNLFLCFLYLFFCVPHYEHMELVILVFKAPNLPSLAPFFNSTFASNLNLTPCFLLQAFLSVSAGANDKSNKIVAGVLSSWYI